jgi:hypothetical protein
MSALFFIFLIIKISIADALFRIIAPLDASEIEFWVGDPSVAVFTASSDIVLEEFCGGVAERAADLENVFFFPVACILSRTFHRIIIISFPFSNCNGNSRVAFPNPYQWCHNSQFKDAVFPWIASRGMQVCRP